jgi:tetratricopeptide (TPR) repeat protein
LIAAPLALCLGGCAGARNSAWTRNPALQTMARAVIAGNRYDDMTIALRNDDRRSFIANYNVLQRMPEGVLAHPLAAEATAEAVNEGTAFESAAAGMGARAKPLLESESAAAFRYALEITPPDQPDELNNLGYELADKGTTRGEFQLALQLTTLAINDLDRGVDRDGKPYTDLIYRRAITRDSVAWSLFKLGRYDEALATQRRAEKEARQASRMYQESMQPDLYFHLGEIYRALHRPLAAQRQYLQVLKFDSSNAKAIKAIREIGPQVRAAPPGSEPVRDPDID